MSDEITAAITASIADLGSDNADTSGVDSVDSTDSDSSAGSSDTPDPVGDQAGGTDDSTDSSIPAVAGEAEPVAPVEPVEPVETDPFAVEHGIKSKDKSGRENRIPFSRVQKINENAVKKARTAWESETLAPVNAKVSEYETRLTNISNVENIMFNEPARFVEMLRSVPGYEQVLPTAGKQAGSGNSAIEPATGAIDWSKAPKSDTEQGYSDKGLTDLLSWTVERAPARAIAATEDRLSKRYAPIETAFNRTQKGREQAAQMAQSTNTLVGHATENWPQFKENHEAITKVLIDDSQAGTGTAKMSPQAALEAAYHKVVFGKLTTDRNALRQEILAELKSAPASTSVSRSTTAGKQVGPPDGVDPITWAIKQSMAGLK